MSKELSRTALVLPAGFNENFEPWKDFFDFNTLSLLLRL